MTTLEIIVSSFGIMATTLGGVWFIFSKGMKLGDMRSKIDSIEEKTRHINCSHHRYRIDEHEKSINRIESRIDGVFDSLNNVKADVSVIKVTLKTA